MSQIEIQAELDNAQPSDIIMLPPGTLKYPIIINKPCTVLGQDGTVIDVSELDEYNAVIIASDNVSFSDISVINKKDTGYCAISIGGKSIALERLNTVANISLKIENCDGVEFVESVISNSVTGTKITNSMNIEINACDFSECAVGLDIVGASTSQGSVDSYQGFGLNVQEDDLSSLLAGNEYKFKIDGMIFSFEAIASMTFGDIVNKINSIPGLNPTYTAEFLNGDIIIKTQNEEVLIESDNNIKCLITELNITPNIPINNNTRAYAPMGLNISPNDVTPILPKSLMTFYIDGKEVQFFSSESDGTTYQELVDILNTKINSMGYTAYIENRDIRISNNNVPVVLTKGTRFKDLLTTLGVVDIPQPFIVSESKQGLGLNINATDATLLTTGLYTIIINDVSYEFIITSTNPTYQKLIDLLNSLENFKKKFIADIYNGDIVITTTESSIYIERIGADIFTALGTTISESINGSEGLRLDRSHNINIVSSLIHNNGIGVRIMNSNDITFTTNTKIYSNTNIGIWQMPSSYNVKFRGEIYNNKNYGVKNTDKAAVAKVDAMDSWWGDMTGPSMFGPGEGDKISANVSYSPIRQSGTVLDLSYPKTREFVLGALGYPIVKVELTDEQIAMCIDKAISKYMQYRTPEPIQRYVPITASNGIQELPLDIPKEEVIEVTYSPNADIFAQLSGSGESFMMTYYMNGSSNNFLSDFYVAMSYKETMESVLGIGASYEFLSIKKADGSYADAIRLSPKPSGTTSLGLLVNRPLTEDEIDSIEWIHRYSLAWSKLILSQIRGKFGSIPGPTGEMQLNSSSLEAQGQQEIEKLEETVMLMGEPLGFKVM